MNREQQVTNRYLENLKMRIGNMAERFFTMQVKKKL